MAGRGDLIKLLWWDGDGLCLFAKRLERGRFVWPETDSGTVALTRTQLSMLLEGIDWRQPARIWKPEIRFEVTTESSAYVSARLLTLQ